MIKIDLKKRAQRGQSMVEFALSLVLLITLLSGLLDLGRIYFIYTQLEDAAGEGALYLAMKPRCRTSAGAGCSDPGNAMYRIRNSGGGLVDWSDPLIADVNIQYQDTAAPLDCGGDLGIDCYPAPATTYRFSLRDTVVVTITYQVPLLTPIVPQIAGRAFLPLTVRATQSIIDK